MSLMRAKMRVNNIVSHSDSETLNMSAVGKSEGYESDGKDENNTFAMFTPAAELTIHIANPALNGKFNEGQEFYVDFTPVE